MDTELMCENCEAIVESDTDLLDYEELSVCEYCLDELRMLDEQGYQDLSSEGLQDYD